MLGQPRHCDELPGFQRSAHGDDGPERAGKEIAVRPSMAKAADTQASANATISAARLTGVM
jgi:hypothetical protein